MSYEQVVKLRGHALLTKYGGLYGLLREVYPNHHWKAENFVPTAMVKKNQRILLGMVQELFPNEQVFEVTCYLRGSHVNELTSRLPL